MSIILLKKKSTKWSLNQTGPTDCPTATSLFFYEIIWHHRQLVNVDSTSVGQDQEVRTRRSSPAAASRSGPAVPDQQQPLGPVRLVLRFSLLLFGLKEKKTFPPLEWQGHSPNSPRLRIPGCCSNDRTKRELWHDAERLNVLRMCRKARPHRTMVNAPSWRRSPHNDHKEETITVSTVFYL